MNTDITYNRHNGNTESNEAYLAICNSIPQARANVLRAIIESQSGITCKELASKWDVGMNVISGRFSELKKFNLIKKVGVRNGSAIMQHNHG